ncbi:MAG: hypothetical protein MUO40_14000 [Anaerolineaceae bacterium]|nr:hypothetical protein [Anaerolineaceae bacterium]
MKTKHEKLTISQFERICKALKPLVSSEQIDKPAVSEDFKDKKDFRIRSVETLIGYLKLWSRSGRMCFPPQELTDIIEEADEWLQSLHPQSDAPAVSETVYVECNAEEATHRMHDLSKPKNKTFLKQQPAVSEGEMNAKEYYDTTEFSADDVDKMSMRDFAIFFAESYHQSKSKVDAQQRYDEASKYWEDEVMSNFKEDEDLPDGFPKPSQVFIYGQIAAGLKEGGE